MTLVCDTREHAMCILRPTIALHQKAHSLSRRPLRWRSRVGVAEGSSKKKNIKKLLLARLLPHCSATSFNLTG